MRALQQTMPHETFLYLGDTARAPYGTRSRETITAFVAQMTDWLEQKGIKHGLMATDFTVGTGAHRKEIQAADPAAEVFGVGCTKFVPLIEGNRFGSPELKEAIREYAEALQAKQVDTVILGCTHYPFVKSYLEEAFGPGVTVIDPAAATALQAKADLEARNLLQTEGPGHSTICFTGDVQKGKLLAERMLDLETCDFKQVKL